jgi:hypothetical protein
VRGAHAAFAIVAISSAALGAMGFFGLAPAALVGTILFLVSQAAIRRLDPGGAMQLAEIFSLAVTLRWLMAAFSYLVVNQISPGLVAPDEIYYDFSARYYAEFLAGRVPDPYLGSSPGGVILSSALAFWAFGFVPMVPRFVNGVLGAWGVILAALLALRLCNEAVARRTALIVTVVPSLVLFSAINTKDNATMVGSELMLLAFILMRDRLSLGALAAFLAGAGLIAVNRSYELIFVASALGAGFLFNERARYARNLIATLLLSVIMAYVLHASSAMDSVGGDDGSTLEAIAGLRTGYAIGAGSAINVDLVDTSTAGGLALWAPFGLFYFFFMPIPFTGSSLLSLSTSPEMVAWYLLLPSAWRGGLVLARHRFRSIMPLLVYMAASSIGWSMVVTNVGTLYRYRTQVLFIPIIFIAADQIRRKYAMTEQAQAASAALAAARAALAPPEPRSPRLPSVAPAGR